MAQPVPPARRDCDCHYVLHADGGDAEVREWAFWMTSPPGPFTLEVWGSDFEPRHSPGLEAVLGEEPPWFATVAWSSGWRQLNFAC